MANFLLIMSCLLAGYGLKHLKNFPPDTYSGLNAFIIYVSLPSLTLYYIPQLQLNWEMMFPFLAGWLPLLGSIAFMAVAKRFIRLSADTVGCLMLVCGLGNISFLGYPLIQAMYGEEGLKIAVIVGQAAFLALSLLGVPLAIRFQGGHVKPLELVKEVFKFPPFIAFSIGAIVLLSGASLPDALNSVLKRLGDTLTPLAMVSIGLQLSLKAQGLNAKEIVLGLGYKLIIAPLIVWALYALAFGKTGLEMKVSVLEAAMPPMVTASIIASQYGLNPRLASLLVGLGLVVGLPLAYGIWWLFEF